MNSKQLAILSVTLIVCASIIGCSIYYGLTQKKENNVVNETDNIAIDNLTENEETEISEDSTSYSSNNNAKSSSNSYDDGYEYSPQFNQEIKLVSDGIIDRNGKYLEQEINGHTYDSEGYEID